MSTFLSMTSCPVDTKHSTISMLKSHRKSHRRTKGRVERRQFSGPSTFTHLGLDKWSLFWTLHLKSILLSENCCILLKLNWQLIVVPRPLIFFPKGFAQFLRQYTSDVCIYAGFTSSLKKLTWNINIDAAFSKCCIPVVLRVVTPNKHFTSFAISTISVSVYNINETEYLAI